MKVFVYIVGVLANGEPQYYTLHDEHKPCDGWVLAGEVELDFNDELDSHRGIAIQAELAKLTTEERLIAENEALKAKVALLEKEND